jgi:cytochrome c-type biogenesis protein CcmH/NrfF
MRRRTADPDDVGDVVLTTSPAIIHRPIFSAATTPPPPTTKSKKITTIAIECVECKSDTRAEAGARAFVSGPDKLGIVLSSNRLASQEEVDEVLVHELVHIYGEFFSSSPSCNLTCLLWCVTLLLFFIA